MSGGGHQRRSRRAHPGRGRCAGALRRDLLPERSFTGDDDPLCKPEHLEAWGKQATGSVATHVYPGDHFYLRNHLAELIEQLAKTFEQ
ncbi:thioesterase domain-containing protein [Nocardia sp. NPDC023852]|uniref:thioesterase domain-containing protein n=1 Tax=Nocardia sp. NPDC023852 TaxID=3154697 RepID=UPI0033CF3151